MKVSNQNLRISLTETTYLGKSIGGGGEIFKFREIKRGAVGKCIDNSLGFRADNTIQPGYTFIFKI